MKKCEYTSTYNKIYKIITIPCEEDEKETIANSIRAYLVALHRDDYCKRNVVVDTPVEAIGEVVVVIYDACSNKKAIETVVTR